MTKTAGYSGTPLIKKLGLKPDMHAATIAAPEHFGALIENFPVKAYTNAGRVFGEWEYLQLFCKDRKTLINGLPRIVHRLAQGGMIWVSWPKKSSQLWIDLTENHIRTTAFPLGLVDVKVCAVDSDWSGLKLMRRKTPKR